MYGVFIFCSYETRVFILPKKKNQLLYNRYNILIVNQCSILATVECVVKSINKVLVECVCVSMCALCVRVLCQQIVKIANCAYYLGCYRHSMLNAWKTNSQLKRRQTYRWYTIVDHFHFGWMDIEQTNKTVCKPKQNKTIHNKTVQSQQQQRFLRSKQT